MQDSRRYPRLAFRSVLHLFRPTDRHPYECVSHDIGFGGLCAQGACGYRVGEPLSVVIGADQADGLHLDARVVRSDSRGIACEFVGNSPASLEVLEALLMPTWDGERLLDGVVRFAPWGHHDDLAGWMRLTSLVSDWQRLNRRPSAPY